MSKGKFHDSSRFQAKWSQRSQSRLSGGFGSKYQIPKDMSAKEYLSLVAEWEGKLALSGLIDIEKRTKYGKTYSQFNKRAAGHTPSDSSEDLAERISIETQAYYRFCTIFLAHADFKSLFPTTSELYKYLFTLHSEGLSYRQMAKRMSKRTTPKQFRRPRSEFWTHYHVKPILKAMFLWHREHEEGELRADNLDNEAA